MRRCRRWAPALALSSLLCGCGTTVATTGAPSSAVRDGGLTAGGAGSAAGLTAAGHATSPTGTAGGGSGALAAGGTATSGGPAASSAVGAATTGTTHGGVRPHSVTGAVPAHAPGVTDKYVYVGVPYSSQAASADRALGAAAAAPSYDGRAVNNAVVKYANAHGGFAGRQLVPVYYDYNVSDDRNTQDQSACAKWTQDNKVFALYSSTSPILDACAEKEGALAFGTGPLTTYQQFPHLIDPDEIRLDRLGTVTTDGLYSAHYFTGRLGLVTWDDPAYRYTITHGYLPALAAHGVKVWQTSYITVPQTIGALADTSAAVSSAITKFRSLGIDHVIIQDGSVGVFSGGGLTLEWMDQSKSQHYTPRYGQNTYNFPGEAALPSDQMDHALAIDQVDYDPKFDVGWHPNKARELCFKIQADAGLPVRSSNPNDEAIAGSACDLVFFLQQMMNGVSFVNADNAIQAAENSGTSFNSAIVYGTKLIPGRRDGGDMFRAEEYFASCSCLKFQGPPYYAD